jgi:hypothetical protein
MASGREEVAVEPAIAPAVADASGLEGGFAASVAGFFTAASFAQPANKINMLAKINSGVTFMMSKPRK